VERRLAAVMAADMVGYSRLVAKDETGTISRHKAYREDLINPRVEEHDGRVVKGDRRWLSRRVLKCGACRPMRGRNP
jgi:class 3 adenylate cyclase